MIWMIHPAMNDIDKSDKCDHVNYNEDCIDKVLDYAKNLSEEDNYGKNW